MQGKAPEMQAGHLGTVTSEGFSHHSQSPALPLAKPVIRHTDIFKSWGDPSPSSVKPYRKLEFSTLFPSHRPLGKVSSSKSPWQTLVLLDLQTWSVGLPQILQDRDEGRGDRHPHRNRKREDQCPPDPPRGNPCPQDQPTSQAGATVLTSPPGRQGGSAASLELYSGIQKLCSWTNVSSAVTAQHQNSQGRDKKRNGTHLVGPRR